MPHFRDVVERCRRARLVFVDMPIGLPGGGGPPERSCDRLARRRLGPRGSTIFPVPVREAVYAPTYKDACAIQARAAGGRRLSRQVWALVPKMREVDRTLQELGGRAPLLFESHPELCFAALNGGRPLDRSKRHVLGVLDRVALLEPHLGDVRTILHRTLDDIPTTALSGHDALDAMVLAVHARLASRHGMVSLPDPPERDALGFPMGIVFAVGTDPRDPEGRRAGFETPSVNRMV